MNKINVYATGIFPLYCHDDGVLVGQTPVEVTDTAWVQAQIAAGVVAAADNAQQPEDEQPKPKGRQPKANPEA